MKEENSVIKRDFEFRLVEEDEKVSVMLKEVFLMMIFSGIESLILRSSWLKLTFSFEENFLDEEMDVECEVPKAWYRVGFLENSKEEGGRSSFLGNFGEEEVNSSENDSRWDNAGSGGEGNEFWELKLRISFP